MAETETEQVTKEQARATMKQGFVNSLAASGLTDDQISDRVKKYDEQVEKRASHEVGIRDAVLYGAGGE
jgi:hypothetical protein